MADKTKDQKKKEPKMVLEREYNVPLRRGWLKVPKHKRAKKAIKTLKEFLVRHMKIYDRDLRKIKVDNYLNNEIRFRGMKKPPASIRVKAKKYDDGIVRVELVSLPKHIEFAKKKLEKISSEVKKKVEEKKPEEKSEETKQEDKEVKKEEAKEKEEASRDESLELAKKQAREQKHVSKDKKVRIQRKALSR